MRFISIDKYLTQTLGEVRPAIRKEFWRRMVKTMGQSTADWLMAEWKDKPFWACCNTCVADFRGVCWTI